MSRNITSGGLNVSATGAYVGLALPGEVGSWQRECKVVYDLFVVTLLYDYLTIKFGTRVINSGLEQTQKANFRSPALGLAITVCMLMFLVILEIIDMITI